MKNMFALLLVAALFLMTLSGCGGSFEAEPPQPEGGVKASAPANPGGDTWTVLVYLCGTDLETQGGYAGTNIVEMANAVQSDNVSVILQTGGTAEWSIDAISSDELQRWQVVGEDMILEDSQPLASMGDGDTLGEFLRWGVNAYPADKYACVLWDHGGGSVAGIAQDELFGGDTLDLTELASGFSMAGAQFELIGFDACLMSTLETAAALSPYGRYMVASQEWEPGTGWDWTAWLSFLAENPTADGLAAGRVICDGFLEKCAAVGMESIATLAVTDLSKIPALVVAFDSMAAEMKGFTGTPELLRPLTQAIVRAENYGGNNDNEGYANMVDLGDMTLCAEGVLSETGDAVLDALTLAVPYQVSGSARQRSNGLSVYMPLLAVPAEMDAYAQMAAVSGEYLRFLEGICDWKVPPGVVVNQPVAAAETPSEQVVPPVMEPVAVDGLTVAEALRADDFALDYTTELTEDGYVMLTVNKGAEIIRSVAYNLFYLDEESNSLNFLGSDFDLNSNEEGTTYWDNFRNLWPIINDNTCSMLAVDFGEDYILYTVPVTVNGEETNLRMIYHYATESYKIVGTWDGIDSETGMSSRNVGQLADGDVVEFLFGSADLTSGEGSIFAHGGFTVNGQPVVEEATLFDGTFYYQYEITDIFGNIHESDFAILTSQNGEITVEIE